jgi:hypothetical protein
MFMSRASEKWSNVERQLDIPIVYDGITFEEGLRLDLLVEYKVDLCALAPLWHKIKVNLLY